MVTAISQNSASEFSEKDVKGPNKPFRFLCLYLGELPSFIDLFLDSCQNVPQLDFVILTDDERTCPPSPPNVTFQHLTLHHLRHLSRSTLGLEIAWDHPYKISDLKPMFGQLFSEHFVNYEYWGFFDLDQIFSRDLINFFMQGRQEKADIINTHNLWTHGPLMALKNSESSRNLFRKSKDWQSVVTEPPHRAFDECGKKYWSLIQRFGMAADRLPRVSSFLDLSASELLDIDDFECFTTVLRRELERGRMTLFQANVLKESLSCRDFVQVSPDGIRDRHGRAWCGYHWVTEKERRIFHYPSWTEIPPRYYVTRFGFFDSDRPLWNKVLLIIRFCRALVLLVRDRYVYHFRYSGEMPKRPFV